MCGPALVGGLRGLLLCDILRIWHVHVWIGALVPACVALLASFSVDGGRGEGGCCSGVCSGGGCRAYRVDSVSLVCLDI